jgi:flagellar protein FlaJ
MSLRRSFPRFKKILPDRITFGHDRPISDGHDEIHSLVLMPYRLLGDRINFMLPPFRELEKQLLKANIKVTFPAYVAFMLFFSCLGGVSVFAAFVVTGLVLGATFVAVFAAALVTGFSSAIIIFLALNVYPSVQVDTRRRILEEELPYVASHMAVLSRAGLPPEKIFKSMTQIEASGIRSVAAEEAENIIRDVHFLGCDIFTAMERRIRGSPSKKFVDYLDGFISVSRSGGELTNYFLASAKGFMDSARIAAKQLVETLGGLAEVYISVMVVFPLLIVVMLSVMGMVGGGIGGLRTVYIMQIVTYAIVPAVASVILVLLDNIMPPR